MKKNKNTYVLRVESIKVQQQDDLFITTYDPRGEGINMSIYAGTRKMEKPEQGEARGNSRRGPQRFLRAN